MVNSDDRLDSEIAKRRVSLRVPCVFQKVSLGGTIKDKIETVRKYSGEVVLILDGHSSSDEKPNYILAIIRHKLFNNEAYCALVPRGKNLEDRAMHYHDLQELLVAIGEPTVSKTYKHKA
jgi:hypothetical protein